MKNPERPIQPRDTLEPLNLMADRNAPTFGPSPIRRLLPMVILLSCLRKAQVNK